MLDVQKDKVEDEKYSIGCESCHYWQEEINALRVKLGNTLQPKSAFVIDPSKYERSFNDS